MHHIIEDYEHWKEINSCFDRNRFGDKTWEKGGVIKFKPPGLTEPIMFGVQFRADWSLAFVELFPDFLKDPKLEFEFLLQSKDHKEKGTVFSTTFSYNDEAYIQKICRKNAEEFVKEITEGFHKRWLSVKRNENKVTEKPDEKGEEKEPETSSPFRPF